MSAKTPSKTDATAGDQSTPIADRLNSETCWDGEKASVQQAVEDFVGPCPKFGGGRPHVLSYQMPECIGKAVLTTQSIEPLYRYQRDGESVTAWQVADTSQALIIYEAPERWDQPVYMLPFVGETQHDLLWMLMHTLSDGQEFDIHYLGDQTIRSILKTTRAEYRHAAEQLLRKHQS